MTTLFYVLRNKLNVYYKYVIYNIILLKYIINNNTLFVIFNKIITTIFCKFLQKFIIDINNVLQNFSILQYYFI